MASDVKSVERGRPGPALQARTRHTRAAVVAAARTLFAERGYSATTIEAISNLSDTPQPTVYRLFGSKIEILKSVLDVAIAGDDEAVATVDRPHVRGLLAETNPRTQIAAFAAIVRGVMARAAPTHRLLADAARTDHDAAALLADIARQRQDGQRRIARSLARAGALRSGLRERDAADRIYALASPEVYGLLVFDRGWSSERYERWLSETLCDQLLSRSATRDATIGGDRR